MIDVLTKQTRYAATDPARFESKYPGCSNEPPWWPSSIPVRYMETAPGECPVTIRGQKEKVLVAVRAKGTLACWSDLLGVWEVVIP